MKNLLMGSLFFIFLSLAPWACTQRYPVAPLPGPSPTSTPTVTSTPNLTPVCGFTPLAIGGTVSLSYNGPSVIRNLAEWQGLFASTGMIIFAGTPTPTPPPPPVNFANQML